jgi:hypothetical protein
MLPPLLCSLGGCSDQSPAPLVIGMAELRGQTIEIVRRDAISADSSRSIIVRIPLPNRQAITEEDCARLDPNIYVSLSGRHPSSFDYGGKFVPSGLFGQNQVCADSAGGGIAIGGDALDATLRLEVRQDVATVAFSIQALDPLQLVAPLDGHVARGGVVTVAVPAALAGASDVRYPLARFVQGPLDNPTRGDTGLAAAQADGVSVSVPGDATPGAWQLYLRYERTGTAANLPLAIDRCEGFATCTGRIDTAAGALGPVDVVID